MPFQDTDYVVTWTIDVSAGSAREAAEIAQRIMQNPCSTATVFEVQSTPADAWASVTIDLDDVEEN